MVFHRQCYATNQDVKTALPSHLTVRQGSQKGCEVGLPGMVLSAIAAAVGAIMYWAVTYQSTGFRLSTVGIILMIAGAFGFVVSAIIFAASRGPMRSDRHSMDRQVVDAQGNTSSVHEDSKQQRPSNVQVVVGCSFSNNETPRRAARQQNANHLREEYMKCT